MPSLASLPPNARLVWLLGVALALVLLGATGWLFLSELAAGWRLRRAGRPLTRAFPLRRILPLTLAPLYWSEVIRLRWPGELGGPAVWMYIKHGDPTALALAALGAALLPLAVYLTLWGREVGAFGEAQDEDPALAAEQLRPLDLDDEDLPFPLPEPELPMTARQQAQDQRNRFFAHMASGGGVPGMTTADLARQITGPSSPGPEIPVDPETGLLAEQPTRTHPERALKLGPLVVHARYEHLLTFAPNLLLLCGYLLFDFIAGLGLAALLAAGAALASWLSDPKPGRRR